MHGEVSHVGVTSYLSDVLDGIYWQRNATVATTAINVSRRWRRQQSANA